ncbi:hypothetical protein ABIE52_006827 [Rhodococcus sp. OAS809]
MNAPDPGLCTYCALMWHGWGGRGCCEECDLYAPAELTTCTCPTNKAEETLMSESTIQHPDPKKPTPALIEAAYVAQDDLSKPPEQCMIDAAAEIIQAYIDGQGHTKVHVLGHPEASS